MRCHDDAPKPTLAWAQDTGADLAKTYVNGGAVAIGHRCKPLRAKRSVSQPSLPWRYR
jgi:hypothetical protein